MGVRLPAEYQEVEYIESRGGQYFFTDIPIQDNLTVDSVQTFNGGDNYLFGGYTDTGFRTCFNGFYNLRIQSAYSGYYTWGAVKSDNITKYHVVQTQKYGMQVGYIDGTQKLSSKRTGTAPSGSGYCVAFGQRQQAGTVNEKYSGKVYSLKVLQDTKLLANYIPCYRKSDGEIGMYDLVLQKFYTNEGTGVFLKGNDVIGTGNTSPWLMERRRGIIAANIPFVPIYRVKNVPFNGSVFDTGVLLAKEGSVGYTVFAKMDCSNAPYIFDIDFFGSFAFYRYYFHFYANNAYSVWGRKGLSPYYDVSSLVNAERLRWIKTFAVSFNFETRKEVVAFNTDVRSGNMSESYISTETLKINPGKRNVSIAVDELRIYDYPMTAADVRKLVSKYN